MNISHLRDQKRKIMGLFILLLILFLSMLSLIEMRGSPGKEVIELEVWYTYEGYEVIKEEIRQFEKEHPNIRVKTVQQPSSGWLNKILSVAQTGNMPDVFLAKSSWLGELAKYGYIYPLESTLSPKREAMFNPKALTSLTYQGHLWAYPLWMDSLLLFYNKAMFKQQALDFPNENWTEKTFQSVALQLTERSEGKYGLAFNTISPYLWPLFQYAFGHGPLYSNGTIVVNDTASVAAMHYLYNLKYYPKPCVGYDDSSSSATQAFLTGNAAMLIYGGWFIKTLEETQVDFNVTVLPLVESTQLRFSPFVEVKGWGISRDTSHFQESLTLIQYLSSWTVQHHLLEEEYKVPTIAFPIIEGEIKAYPWVLAQMKQINYGQPYPMDPLYNIYSDYMRAALQFILLNHQEIQATLDVAQAGIETHAS